MCPVLVANVLRCWPGPLDRIASSSFGQPVRFSFPGRLLISRRSAWQHRGARTRMPQDEPRTRRFGTDLSHAWLASPGLAGQHLDRLHRRGGSLGSAIGFSRCTAPCYCRLSCDSGRAVLLLGEGLGTVSGALRWISGMRPNWGRLRGGLDTGSELLDSDPRLCGIPWSANPGPGRRPRDRHCAPASLQNLARTRVRPARRCSRARLRRGIRRVHQVGEVADLL